MFNGGTGGRKPCACFDKVSTGVGAQFTGFFNFRIRQVGCFNDHLQQFLFVVTGFCALGDLNFCPRYACLEGSQVPDDVDFISAIVNAAVDFIDFGCR